MNGHRSGGREAGDRPLLRRQTPGDLLRRSAGRFPTRIALVDGEVELTYRELNELANRFASRVLAGTAPGERAVVLLPNSWQLVVALLGLAKAGVVAVPLNPILPPREVEWVIAHAQPRALFCGAPSEGVCDSAIAHGALCAGPVPGAASPDVESFLAEGAAVEPEVPQADDAAVQMLYTSGTENHPKGVVLTHRCLIAHYTSIAVDGEYSADDVELHTHPLAHVAQLHSCLMPELMVGATNIILDTTDPAAVLAAVRRHQVTRMFGAPAFWVRSLRAGVLSTEQMPSLRKVMYGGAPMPVQVLRDLHTALPQVRFWNSYGLTEMSPSVAMLRPDDQLRKAGSAGRPALNVEIQIADERGRPLPAGERGELLVRGPHLMAGYFRDPEASARVTRGGWLHTGDVAVMDGEGFITIVDRLKDLVKAGTVNVSSREVEEVLYEHPAVQEAAVIGVPHPEVVEAIVAVVVPRAGETLDLREVWEHCRISLADFQVPHLLYQVDRLPRTSTGKVVKHLLRRQVADRVQRARLPMFADRDVQPVPGRRRGARLRSGARGGSAVER